ncbi:MAG: BPTI/Kunitz domain-containing protein [Myxococcales bacterium]|nr:BPTI/Kunitz domain-containing protein [Myxococcales bacterium]
MLSHSTWLLLAASLTLAGCADRRCALEPNGGFCQAIFPRAFFNPTTRRCEAFTWGGCGGVVPFDTLEECRMVCGG